MKRRPRIEIHRANERIHSLIRSWFIIRLGQHEGRTGAEILLRRPEEDDDLPSLNPGRSGVLEKFGDLGRNAAQAFTHTKMHLEPSRSCRSTTPPCYSALEIRPQFPRWWMRYQRELARTVAIVDLHTSKHPGQSHPSQSTTFPCCSAPAILP